MHLFFVAAAADGVPLEEHERAWFTSVVRREACISEHVCRVERIDPTSWSVVVMVSNEPSGGLVTSDLRSVMICGYAADENDLRSLRADLNLADRASKLGGRFAPLVVDRPTGRFAMATQIARVDSIFFTTTERFRFWGSQASVLSVLRDGAVTYEPARLITLLHAGFFGDAATPYRGIDIVPPLATVLVDGPRMEQRQIRLAALKKRSLVAKLRGYPLDRIASSLVRAFSLLRSRPAVSVGLTGGMDSRLILAGAVAANVPVDCFTIQKGDPGNPDIFLAREVAARAGVQHRVIERASNLGGSRDTPDALLRGAINTLAATDGMLGIPEPVNENETVGRRIYGSASSLASVIG